MLRASSVRPAPISPAMPTISPRRTVRAASLHDRAVVVLRVHDRPVRDLEERPRRSSGSWSGKRLLEVAADHPADDPVLVDRLGA